MNAEKGKVTSRIRMEDKKWVEVFVFENRFVHRIDRIC